MIGQLPAFEGGHAIGSGDGCEIEGLGDGGVMGVDVGRKGRGGEGGGKEREKVRDAEKKEEGHA